MSSPFGRAPTRRTAEIRNGSKEKDEPRTATMGEDDAKESMQWDAGEQCTVQYCTRYLVVQGVATSEGGIAKRVKM